MRRKFMITVILSATAMTLLICFGAAALFHFSGDLVQHLGPALDLNKKETAQISAALGQLRGAAIRLPLIQTFILSVAAGWLISAVRRPNAAARRIIRLLLSILLSVFIFLSALLLTKVNTIRFANVLLSLLTLLPI